MVSGFGWHHLTLAPEEELSIMEIINFALKGENMTSDNKKEPVMTWLSRLEESEGAEVGESMSKIINMASRSPDVDGGWINS